MHSIQPVHEVTSDSCSILLREYHDGTRKFFVAFPSETLHVNDNEIPPGLRSDLHAKIDKLKA